MDQKWAQQLTNSYFWLAFILFGIFQINFFDFFVQDGFLLKFFDFFGVFMGFS